MKAISPWKSLSVTLCMLFAAQGSSAAASNPASQKYLDEALQRLAAQAQRFTAGNGILIENGVISITPNLAVGDFYQGGIVFYVDDTNRHGLAVALEPPSTATGAFSNSAPNGDAGQRMYIQGAGLGSGALNTAVMVAFQSMSEAAVGVALTAGPLAAGYSTDAATGLDVTYCSLPTDGSVVTTAPVDCVNGWYLPNVQEWLVLASTLPSGAGAVNLAITNNGGTAIGTGDYWISNTNAGTGSSSTTTPTGTDAYYISDPTAATPTAMLDATWSDVKNVRAIRRF
jgi:hypothetical protein